MDEQHRVGNPDDDLAGAGLTADDADMAVKRVLAFQIAALMERQQLSRSELARTMKTSRAAVDRLLDPDSGTATLATMEKAALALGVRL